jgi:GntR family transcriptional regulator
MKIQVDSSSPIPLYYQIREQLRQQILSGSLKPGDALPGEERICTETGVSRMTARQALSQLANDGLVVRKRGKGTFVAAPKATLDEFNFPLFSYTQMLEQAGLQAKAQILLQNVTRAEAPIAEKLELGVGESVVHIERLRSIHAEVMSLESSFYPYARFPALAEQDLTDRSIYAVLQELYGVIPARAVQTVELSVAGSYEARLLGIHEATPVAQCSRMSFTDDGQPIEFTQVIHRGDRFRMVVHLSRQEIQNTFRLEEQ